MISCCENGNIFACEQSLHLSDTSGGVAVASWTHSQQHSHVVSAHLRAPTERGSLSSCFLLKVSLVLISWISHIVWPYRSWYCHGISLCDACSSQIQCRRQEKHDFAVYIQGDHSYHRCGESPRAIGQRVPAGDCMMLALTLAT